MRFLIIGLVVVLVIIGFVIWDYDRSHIHLKEYSPDGKWIVQILKRRVPGSKRADITLEIKATNGSYLTSRPLGVAGVPLVFWDEIKENAYAIKWLSNKKFWISSKWGPPSSEKGYYQWQTGFDPLNWNRLSTLNFNEGTYRVKYSHEIDASCFPSIDELNEYLKSPDAEIRQTAEEALKKLGVPAEEIQKAKEGK